jgi:uncharacterized membrane protein
MLSKRKTIIKTISYRVTGTITTLLIVFFMTGEIVIASSVASIEVILKMLIYYIHERIWHKFAVEEPEYHL